MSVCVSVCASMLTGGGNEKPGSAPVAPPAGAVATFTVSGLNELAELLEQAATTHSEPGT